LLLRNISGIPHGATGALADLPATVFTDIYISSFISPAGDDDAGGDWCEVVAVSDDVLALTVGDVAGHGRSVQPFMCAIRDALVAAVATTHEPAAALEIANRAAIRFFDGDGVIVTAIVAYLNHRQHTLTFANAGHPPPLMMTGDRAAYLAQRPADLPLGIYTYHRAANYVVALPLDAVVLFYTDGITEHDRDPVRGEVELAEAARLSYDQPAIDLAHAVANYVLAGKRGDDDAALLALRSVRAS
jgi:serine phosphatase RsbU (regulator of sigma subunit)